MDKKVSFICTSYRRYRCVQRIIKQYLLQDYPNKELVILNTDPEYLFTLDSSLKDENIIVVNNHVDYAKGEFYTNRGDICRDAVDHATGDYFMLADDDDIYLPWHIRQAVDGINRNGLDSWKPERSFFKNDNKLETARNTMEASIIVKMQRIRHIGFRSDLTGYEGISWYTQLRDEGQLNEHEKYYIPSYCFNWASDPFAGHKQSGDIDNPDNFENHKKYSTDISSEPLTPCTDSIVNELYKDLYDYLKTHQDQYDPELWQKYIAKYI